VNRPGSCPEPSRAERRSPGPRYCHAEPQRLKEGAVVSPLRSLVSSCPAAVLLVLGGAVWSCSGPGQYVWFEQLPSQTTLTSNEYLIGVGDTVSIRVLNHEEMTIKEPVRSDGRLSLLLIGDVEAKGKRPSALQAELEGRLGEFIKSPSVAVNVEAVEPATVLFFGEVAKPGVYPLDTDARLAHAMALAGGLTDYAARNSVFVVRREPAPIRIRFNYEAIYRNTGGAGDFLLHRGDQVEVE
jgi:polysaccharide export outer membrane protein